MNNNEYMQKAQRTSNTITAMDKIENGVYGLCGEAGEIIDHVKKHKFQGHNLDIEHIAEECGDLLWYLAEILTGIGYTLDEIKDINIAKLMRRYPGEGFDAERSINRP